MINLKEHIKLTGVYTFFAAFPAILQVVVYPIIEGNDRLGPTDYGYLAIAEAFVSFMVIITLYGMAITTARFYFDYLDNKDGYKKLVSTIFTGIILRGLFIFGIVIAFSDFLGSFFSNITLSNFSDYGYYLPIIAFNRSIVAVALSLFRNEKRIRNFIVISIVSGIGRSVFQVIGVLYFDLSFKGYLMGTAIGGGIAALIIIIYVYRTCGLSYSESINAQLRKFSFPLFLTDFLFWGILFFDRFMLLKNPTQLGIYDNAMKLAMGIQFISQGLASSVQPELYNYFKDGVSKNEKDIKKLSNLFMAENIAIIGIAILPLIIFIRLFYETELILSAEIIPIILMKYILYAQFQIFLWPILYKKESKIFFGIMTLVLVIIIFGNYLLVPQFGYYGSIYTFLVAGILQVIFMSVYQNKKLLVKWNKMKALYSPLMLVILVAIADILRNLLQMNLYLFAILITFFILGGLIYLYRNEIYPLIAKFFVRR